MVRRRQRGCIDSVLCALGPLGRYQVLQLIVIKIGMFGAACQLLNNIFIGRAVTSHQCAHGNSSDLSAEVMQETGWNSTHVTYGSCEITVSKDNLSSDALRYPCLYGNEYGYRRELSFRTEFDLVCDRKLLGGLAQSFVIMGQGFGAVISSWFSDRFGRKKVLVASQFGLLTLGMAVGVVPSYALLGLIKFLIGCFQQGVVATSAAMSVEWFPAERRAITSLTGSTIWAVCASSMALVAFLLQDYTWRYLQFALSGVSLLAFFQWWYLDESLRWLVVNGRTEEIAKVLKRAARVNGKDHAHILHTMESSAKLEDPMISEQNHEKNSRDDVEMTNLSEGKYLEKTLEGSKTEKMSVLDIFRHKRLLCNACVMWFGWFTCAFSFFALYMMSTSLHGNRFLNYFLTALMELPPGFMFYFMVDRFGRKTAARPLYAIAGFGLITSGVCRHFAAGNTVLQTLSVVAAMLGMVGASGMFGACFFLTPELFPTNLRNQAIGISSFFGRCGGMLAPFMTDLADVAVWAPGALIGSLCFGVVIVMHFLPETKGRELPNTFEDIEQWGRGKVYEKKMEKS